MNTISRPKRWQMRTSERVAILIIGDFLVAALALFFALYIWAAGDAWMKFSLEFIIDSPHCGIFCYLYVDHIAG